MRHLHLLLVVALLTLTSACPPRPSATPPGTDAAAGSPPPGHDTLNGAAPSYAPTGMPSGTSCAGRSDCAGEQVCVSGVCRFRHVSVKGEILTTAARAQLDTGDVSGAVRTYDQVLEAYESQEAPVPAEVLCGAAGAALRAAETPEEREVAARRADACFRGSLPGDESRMVVQRAVSRLRYDGLDLSLFDQDQPASHFFTEDPSRPTVDAVEIALELPDRDMAGYEPVRTTLQSEDATRAIAGCFIRDWESRHERSASAPLTIDLTSHLRDMGDYDVYTGQVTLTPTGGAEGGFVGCLAEALTALFENGPRLARSISWREEIEVTTRLR
ncbi:MAG: hypothetical protein GW913_03995 [Myxococcales bacterium]|nr:hypothetical protein [Myxococcales bacterium]